MFHTKTHYPQLSILEDNYDVIRAEYEAIKKLRKYRWPEQEKYKGAWDVFGLYHNGRKLKTSTKLCPKTTEIIESIGPVSMAGFSIMTAGTVILPHIDKVDTDIHRIHLGVDIPEGDCAFFVQGVKKVWKNGEAFLFDPKLLHSAWNKACGDRVILLLDFSKFF